MKWINFLSALLLLTTADLTAQQSTSPAPVTGMPLTSFDYSRPVLKLEGEQLTNHHRFLRFSVLTGYREGVEPIKGQFNSNFRPQFDQKAGTYRLMMFNLSIQNMFTGGLRKSCQVILDVKDPSKYRYDPKYGPEKDWLRKNGYCYELCLPIGLVKSMKPIYDDLERLFRVKCRQEKRMVNTLVLIRTSGLEKFKSTGGENSTDISHGKYKNTAMGAIGAPFYENDIMPFLDETKYGGLIDVTLDINVRTREDIPALRKALLAYDLDIKEEPRMMDMLVISEIK